MKILLVEDDAALREVGEAAAPVAKSNPSKVILIVHFILMAAGSIAQYLILTGKIHKLEEERL